MSARQPAAWPPATAPQNRSRSLSTKKSHTGTTTRPMMKVAARTSALIVGASRPARKSAMACPRAASCSSIASRIVGR